MRISIKNTVANFFSTIITIVFLSLTRYNIQCKIAKPSRYTYANYQYYTEANNLAAKKLSKP